MTISGMELDFDLDNRKDFTRFKRASETLEKKRKGGGIDDNDMETFLCNCLKPEQAKELLKDGRISTLTKVFVEFFSEALEQYSRVSGTYSEIADACTDLNARVESLGIMAREL